MILVIFYIKPLSGLRSHVRDHDSDKPNAIPAKPG